MTTRIAHARIARREDLAPCPRFSGPTKGFARRSHRVSGYAGDVDLLGGVDLFATKEPPSYWRSMLEQQGDLPIPGYAYLPAFIQPRTNSLAAFVESASGKAVTLWYEYNPRARERAIADARSTLKALEDMRKALDEIRLVFHAVGAQHGRQNEGRWPAWAEAAQTKFNRLHTNYRKMAALVYGNAFPLDAKTRNPVLPAGMEAAVERVDGLQGLLVGTYDGTMADGVSLGVALSEYIEDDFGIEPITVVVIGIVALGLVGLAICGTLSVQANADARKAEAEAESIKAICAADPKGCGKSAVELAKEHRKNTEAGQDGFFDDLGKAAAGGIVTLLALGGTYYYVKKKIRV
jgi:hypothetical protein